MPILNTMRIYGIYEDIRQALRLIALNRTLALGVFLSLSMGIAVSTSLFNLIDSVLFRTLPAPHADRLVQVASANPASAVDPTSYADFDDLGRRTSAFEILTTAHHEAATVEGIASLTFIHSFYDRAFFRSEIGTVIDHAYDRV